MSTDRDNFVTPPAGSRGMCEVAAVDARLGMVGYEPNVKELVLVLFNERPDGSKWQTAFSLPRDHAEHLHKILGTILRDTASN